MIHSFILTSLILAIAACYGLSQKERLSELRSEWECLREEGRSYGLPENSAATDAATRLGLRQKKIEAFATELIAFMKETEEAPRSGNHDELESQQRGIDLFMQWTNFSRSELKLLIVQIIAESSIKNETKSEMVMRSAMMLSEQEPHVALALVMETKDKILKNSQISDHFISMAIGQLAAEDPKAALEWANTLQEGALKNDLLRTINEKLEHAK